MIIENKRSKEEGREKEIHKENMHEKEVRVVAKHIGVGGGGHTITSNSNMISVAHSKGMAAASPSSKQASLLSFFNK